MQKFDRAKLSVNTLAPFLTALVLLAGCGGSDPAPKQQATAPDLQPTYHRVANDMRDIGALAVGECGG